MRSSETQINKRKKKVTNKTSKRNNSDGGENLQDETCRTKIDIESELMIERGEIEVEAHHHDKNNSMSSIYDSHQRNNEAIIVEDLL